MNVRDLMDELRHFGPDADIVVAVEGDRRSIHFPVESAQWRNLAQLCADEIVGQGDGVFAVLMIRRALTNDEAGCPRERQIDYIGLLP